MICSPFFERLSHRAFLVAEIIKTLPAMQETQAWSLVREGPPKKEMATHSSILAWRIQGQRKLTGYSPWGHKELDTTEWLTHTHANDTTLTAESKEELKSLLMKVKEKTEKADLNLHIQNTKIIAPGPITSWQIDGEKVTDFIFSCFQNHYRWWLQPWN